MTKWYDRIGNTIEMRVGNGWIKGIIINGDRTGDGFINMETLDGKKYWCGVGGEYAHFRKCDDSDGDLITNADRIRSMSDKELTEWLTNITDDAQSDSIRRCDYQWDEWLKEEMEQS